MRDGLRAHADGTQGRDAGDRRANEQHKLRKPADLAGVTLVSTETRPGDWEQWLAVAGVGSLRPAHYLRFDHFFVTLQAIIDGMGVGIGTIPTLEGEVDAGRIAAPFAKVRAAGDTYYCLVPRDSDKPRHLRLF